MDGAAGGSCTAGIDYLGPSVTEKVAGAASLLRRRYRGAAAAAASDLLLRAVAASLRLFR